MVPIRSDMVLQDTHVTRCGPQTMDDMGCGNTTAHYLPASTFPNGKTRSSPLCAPQIILVRLVTCTRRLERSGPVTGPCGGLRGKTVRETGILRARVVQSIHSLSILSARSLDGVLNGIP